MIVVRYADDIIVGFEHETDAHRFRDAMRARLQEFSLSLHPDKTRLFEFGRHAAARRAQCGLGKPETFNFLGFTFVCGKSRRGRFLIERKTRRDRMRAKLREIKEEMRRRRHQNAARPDLCGGRSAMRVPTAITDRRILAGCSLENPDVALAVSTCCSGRVPLQDYPWAGRPGDAASDTS